jgi:hypothetical protein
LFYIRIVLDLPSKPVYECYICLSKLEDNASIHPSRMAAQKHQLALYAACGDVDAQVVEKIDQ